MLLRIDSKSGLDYYLLTLRYIVLGGPNMNTTLEILESAKKALGTESDYAFGKKMGFSHQKVSNWRKGTSFDDDAAEKIADVLGREPGEIMAISQASRAKDEKARSRWLRVAALVAAAALPPAAGASGTLHNENTSDLFLSKSLKGYTLLDV